MSEWLIQRYEHNHFRGWQVATKRKGKRFMRYFSDRPYDRRIPGADSLDSAIACGRTRRASDGDTARSDCPLGQPLAHATSVKRDSWTSSTLVPSACGTEYSAVNAVGSQRRRQLAIHRAQVTSPSGAIFPNGRIYERDTVFLPIGFGS